MSQTAISAPVTPTRLTQHTMLVLWGLYAQQIGLIDALGQVKLHHKRRKHAPQCKVLEFLVAILAGYAHLQDISRSAHPLDQDTLSAEAWGQTAWADYSGVSRTLQQLQAEEVSALIAALNRVSQPFIELEVERALSHTACLVYDADLTGRPVSSSSQSYPESAFGYMGETIRLGYQAALVSLHSPTYGRLWLSSQLHPGDTVSSTQAQALIHAAETRVGRRPYRRVELLAQRLAQAEADWEHISARLEQGQQQLQAAQHRRRESSQALAEWRQEVVHLSAEYARTQRTPSAQCRLTRAQRKLAMYEARLPRAQATLAQAERRVTHLEAHYDEAAALVAHLRSHHTQLLNDNATNPAPVRVILRLDSGFASRENLAWLIEMGYDLYSKGRSPTVRTALRAAITPETPWTRVGRNACLVAWPTTTVDDYFLYPLDVALVQYQLGDTQRHAVLLHFGQEAVTTDGVAWFQTYNGRQTIEAGIKEGKLVFQMHHLKVRSAHALRLQEQFACFAANFVRFAADWLTRQVRPATIPTHSVKQMVQVGAHTSAWVQRQGEVWLFTFTEQSLYAGRSLRLGVGPLQLPLPFAGGVQFSPF